MSVSHQPGQQEANQMDVFPSFSVPPSISFLAKTLPNAIKANLLIP
jgi:hypothetical protein